MKTKQAGSTLLRCRTRAQIASLKSKRQLSFDLRAGQIACVTRAVEQASAINVGEEPGKLLFFLALGLNPTQDKPSPGPFVEMERLKPQDETEARALTRYRLFKIADQLLQKLEMKHNQEVASTQYPSIAGALSSDMYDPNGIINLVSSDDEANENTVDFLTVPKSYRKSILRQQNPSAVFPLNHGPVSTTTSSTKLRRKKTGVGAKSLNKSELEVVLSWVSPSKSSQTTVKRFPSRLFASKTSEHLEIEDSASSFFSLSSASASKINVVPVITID